MKNKESVEKIIRFINPSFKPRWIVYEDLLRKQLNKNKIWLDLGCGKNADVEEKKDLVLYAAGVDIYRSRNLMAHPFIMANIDSLPFKANSIDVISLQFVIEHISKPEKTFTEFFRILKRNGVVILSTTNLLSPVVFVPKILPYILRKNLIKRFFKVYDEDIFPTYHRFNTYFKVRNRNQKLKFHLTELEFIQDIPDTTRTVFFIFFICHLLTKSRLLRIFRSTIIAAFKKREQ